MKFPSSVVIGSTTYTVRLAEEPLLLDHRECFGLIEYNVQRISVSAAAAEDRRWVTLWHEIFHGFVEERGLTLDGEQEEQIVEAFARSMHQFLRDNPGLFTAVPPAGAPDSAGVV